MNSAIELHDSECLAVEPGMDGRGFVLLDAYVHQSEGHPGWDKGEGGTQCVRLAFENINISGLVGDLPAYIYEGSLAAGDVVLNNLIEFPASHAGACFLEMMLSEDARIIVVSGTAVTITAKSAFRSVEPFIPADTAVEVEQ